MDVFLNLHGGVAGDMLVAGLLDAGAPLEVLEAALKDLPGEFRWHVRQEERHGIAGTRFLVEAQEGHVHRHLADVLALVGEVRLPERAADWARRAFTLIAEAEARAHGTTPEAVHFHEVGAIDALVDIVGACALMAHLDPRMVRSSAVPVGSGTVECAHGTMPVPAPGTCFLLEGIPSCGHDLLGERATPTGVALLRAWDTDFAHRPAARLERAGHGLGSRDPEDRANLLRVELEVPAVGGEWLVELCSLVDDQSGEVLGHALEQLHAEGAVDAYAVAAVAKKNRPAFEVVVLCDAERQQEFEDRCFRLLGTLGMRVRPVQRSRRPRTAEERDTPLGPLSMKVRLDGAEAESTKPEFADLVRLAESLGLTPREALDRLQASPPREPSA